MEVMVDVSSIESLFSLQWKTHVHQVHVMKMHVVIIQWALSHVIVTLAILGMESHAQVTSKDVNCRSSHLTMFPLLNTK